MCDLHFRLRFNGLQDWDHVLGTWNKADAVGQIGEHIMTYGEELAKWKAAQESEQEQQAAQEAQRIASIERRTLELERHFEAQEAASVGFAVTASDGQIILDHNVSRQEIQISIESDSYALVARQRLEGSVAPPLPDSARTVQSIAEIDHYVMGFQTPRWIAPSNSHVPLRDSRFLGIKLKLRIHSCFSC